MRVCVWTRTPSYQQVISVCKLNKHRELCFRFEAARVLSNMLLLFYFIHIFCNENFISQTKTKSSSYNQTAEGCFIFIIILLTSNHSAQYRQNDSIQQSKYVFVLGRDGRLTKFYLCLFLKACFACFLNIDIKIQIISLSFGEFYRNKVLSLLLFFTLFFTLHCIKLCAWI